MYRALEIADVPARNHVLVNFDADGTFPKNYLRSLVDYYDNYDVDSIITRRTHTIPEDASFSFFRSHQASMHSHLSFDLENAIGYPHYGYSTPQITLRADAARSLNGFSPMIENEDLDLGRRLEPFKVVQVPDIMVTQSDRAREDGFDSVRRLSLMENSRSLPGYITMGQLFHAAISPEAHVIEQEIKTGKIHWQTGLEHLLKRVRRATYGILPKETKLHADDPEHRINFYFDWLRKQNSDRTYPPLMYLLSDAIVFDETGLASTWAFYITRYIANGLTAAERRRFEDQWSWRQTRAQVLIHHRIQDLHALLRGELPPVSAQNFADPFRRHLRMNVKDGLRAGILEWQADPLNRNLSGEQRMEKLRLLLPDWLTFEKTEYAYDVENIRFLLDWILTSALEPERNRQTVRAFDAYE